MNFYGFPVTFWGDIKKIPRNNFDEKVIKSSTSRKKKIKKKSQEN
jgi:hypothetical protein